MKREADAALAVKFGADAIGVLVGQKHSSPDFVTAEQACRIVRSLPPFINSVLVTHLEDAEEVMDLVRRCQVNTLQIHSAMMPEGIQRIRAALGWLKLIKAIHVVNENSILEMDRYTDLVDAFLLDTVLPATGQVGGTGKTHDWAISRQIVARAKRPVILAGGLTAENVARAIRAVSPFGVDVNSGTKGPDGFKDAQKLRDFISRAKSPPATKRR